MQIRPGEKNYHRAVTVGDLVEHLKTFDQSMPVGYHLHSEYQLLGLWEIEVKTATDWKAHGRTDGWIHEVRPDMPSINYLILPGN